MAIKLDDIKKPIAEDLKKFNKNFKQSMKSDVALLDRVTQYIVQRKGKQMRPMFVFLSAQLCGGVTDATHIAASLVELIHTATLVHDDVVDDSYKRRGMFSINHLWKNKVAVLVGDYLFSKTLLLSVDNNQHLLLKIVADAVREMSEGELLQIEKARRLDIKEEIYFEIIRKKTAALISSACAVGAASSTQDEVVVEKVKLLGEKIGIAFQIKDDLFDFGDTEIGKPRGIDIKERKMTLPLIYALNNATKSQKRRLINIVKNENENSKSVNELIEYVRQSGGIEFTIEKMNNYKQQAEDILNEFPDGEAKTSLQQLIDFTILRKH